MRRAPRCACLPARDPPLNFPRRPRAHVPQEEKRKKLQEEGTPEAQAELEKLDRMKKLHVGNICQDK